MRQRKEGGWAVGKRAVAKGNLSASLPEEYKRAISKQREGKESRAKQLRRARHGFDLVSAAVCTWRSKLGSDNVEA